MIRIEMSERLKRLPAYLFVEIDRAKKRARDEGRDIIDLGVGDPDIPTPRFIIDALNKAVRDPATQAYTRAFWLHALGRQLRGFHWRPAAPITCVQIDVRGLAGLEKADEALRLIAGSAADNVRAYDLVGRSGEARLVVALLRCPEEFAPRAGERIVGNIQRLTVGGLNQRYAARLELAWRCVTLPPARWGSAHMRQALTAVLDERPFVG